MVGMLDTLKLQLSLAHLNYKFKEGTCMRIKIMDKGLVEVTIKESKLKFCAHTRNDVITTGRKILKESRVSTLLNI
jgi:hypothetical protein